MGEQGRDDMASRSTRGGPCLAEILAVVGAPLDHDAQHPVDLPPVKKTSDTGETLARCRCWSGAGRWQILGVSSAQSTWGRSCARQRGCLGERAGGARRPQRQLLLAFVKRDRAGPASSGCQASVGGGGCWAPRGSASFDSEERCFRSRIDGAPLQHLAPGRGQVS
jgi:hypothetical protein